MFRNICSFIDDGSLDFTVQGFLCLSLKEPFFVLFRFHKLGSISSLLLSAVSNISITLRCVGGVGKVSKKFSFFRVTRKKTSKSILRVPCVLTVTVNCVACLSKFSLIFYSQLKKIAFKKVVRFSTFFKITLQLTHELKVSENVLTCNNKARSSAIVTGNAKDVTYRRTFP